MDVERCRDQSIDFIRMLACLAVVLMHTVSIFWYKIPARMLTLQEYQKELYDYITAPDLNVYQSWGWYFCSFVDALTRFSVPCFVMISGALILKREEITSQYVRKKALYIIKLIFVWGSIQALIRFLINIWDGNVSSFSQYLQIIINGNGVFWFLYMLLALYLASPVFNTILKNKRATSYFLTLWFLFAILLPCLKEFVSSLETNIKFSYLNMFPAYTGYYVLGGYLADTRRSGGGVFYARNIF